MEFIIPDSVAGALAEFESRKQGFAEYELADAIQRAVGAPENLSAPERRGTWIEMSAFQFMEATKEPKDPWNSVFAPMASLRAKDGSDLYIPNIQQADETVIEYWSKRSRETNNPIMRARYADLVWEFFQLVTKRKREVDFARRAIDSYLQAVETGYYATHVEAANFLVRALSLSLSIGDQKLVTRSKVAAFTLHNVICASGARGMWWVLFDTLYDENGVDLSDAERTQIIDGLEQILKTTSDRSVSETFDPWAVQRAAERLERHYRRAQKLDEVRRVAETYGRAFEQAATDANPLLAVAWLQPVYEKYRDLGMHEAANHIHALLDASSKAAPSTMKRIEVPIKISQDEFDKYIEALTAGGLEVSLRNVAVRFIPNAGDLRAFNERMKDVAPLSARIPMRIFESDYVAAVIGPQDEDPDGRLLHQIGQRIHLESPWLGMALDKLVERYGMTPEQLGEFLAASPLFDPNRKGIIAVGLGAALGADPIKAIHILVPQIEYALRSLAGLMGIPKTARGPVKGTMQVKGLGEILNDKIFRKSMDENIRLYLIALLVDQRGVNLRNRVAHGLMELDHMNKSLSDRLLHVLLMLSVISPEDQKTPSPQAVQLIPFRLVRYIYDEQGRLAERAILSGRHQTRDDAVLAAKAEAEKDASWQFTTESGEWRMTKERRLHVLKVEG